MCVYVYFTDNQIWNKHVRYSANEVFGTFRLFSLFFLLTREAIKHEEGKLEHSN